MMFLFEAINDPDWKVIGRTIIKKLAVLLITA